MADHYAAMHNDDSTTSALAEPAINPLPILMEGIARRRLIQAQYNGAIFKLAPYQLFERHKDLFISALNMSKAWSSDDERRLGQFKIAGLSALELIDEEFAPIPSYDGSLPRAEDMLLLAV